MSDSSEQDVELKPSPLTESVAAGGTTPKTFTGAWETPEFAQLLSNAVNWGVA